MPKSKRKKSLKIAHLHWGFPPIIGGVETHLTILLPALVKMGHKVNLLTCSAEGEKVEDNYKGVDIFRSPMMDLNWLFRRGLSGIDEEVRTIFSNFIDKFKPDVIHTHNMHYFSMVHGRSLSEIAREKGIPFILTAHNVWADTLFLSMMRRIKWTHIIAVSHFINHELIGTGIKHTHVTTVHHGIDQNLYNPKIKATRMYKKYPRLKREYVIFHPARMGLAKGCDVSVKALRIIVEKFPKALLVLAGTKNIIDWGATQNKDIAYIVGLVDSFKLRKNVLMDVYRLEDMPYIYAASKVCVYPSSSPEPFGLTMLESMASGRPIIVTKTGGMPEIVNDGINGFVIPTFNFENLANRIMQLFNDKDLRQRLGNAGRAVVEQRYTKETMAKNTLDVYRKFV